MKVQEMPLLKALTPPLSVIFHQALDHENRWFLDHVLFSKGLSLRESR